MSTLLETRSLVRVFEPREPGGRGTRRVVRAVDGVDLLLGERQSVGMCGESGSGKTTLAYLIAGLLRPTSGALLFRGRPAREDSGEGTTLDLARLSQRAWRPLRREIQIVFQSAEASLNPRRTVGDSVADPLRVQHLETRRGSRGRVSELLVSVGLDPNLARCFPAALSAGQRQRAALARALAPGPRLLVCDEPVSALDASTQAEILNLLARLQTERGVAILLIAHDLAVLRNVTNRIVVMHRGRLVEQAPTDELFHRPRHPYTARLLSAIPRIGEFPPFRGEEDGGRGDLAVEGGCTYRGSCSFADAGCREEDPQPRDVGLGHLVSCRRADEIVLSSSLR